MNFRLNSIARHIRSVAISASSHSRPLATMSTQKAVFFKKNGGIDVLEYGDVEIPKPGEGQVLIKNQYAGVNFVDTYFREGVYPTPNLPLIQGRESTGVIEAVGAGVKDLKKGDLVAALHDKAHAEYSLAPAMLTIKIPDGISSELAASALLQGLTAIVLVTEAHPVKKGQWLLVHAAAGGVGLIMLQLIKQMGGRSIASVSTDEKAKLAKENGAEEVIVYRNEDIATRVKEITGGKGVAASYDSVGKATFQATMDSLARKGEFVSYGNASGVVPPFTVSQLQPKCIKICRPSLFNYLTTREEFLGFTDELFKQLKSGLKVKVYKTYPLKDAPQAQKDLESQKTTGRLLIKI